MGRFKYPREFEDPNASTPVACLASFIFEQPEFEALDTYYRIFLQTQQQAIRSQENFHLNLILKAGLKGLPFLELYLKYARTEHSSRIWSILLLTLDFKDILTVEFFRKVLEIPEFDPNARINCWTCAPFAGLFKDPEDYCLLSGMITDVDITSELFFTVYNCKRVDTTASTGKVFLQTVCPEVVPFLCFDDRSLLFLATVLHNKIAFPLSIETGSLEVLKALYYVIWYCIWKIGFIYLIALKKLIK